MVRVIKVISAIAAGVLAIAVFAPQAKADAAPSGLLVYICALPNCVGSIVANGSGGFGGSFTIGLSSATNSNRGDEVGATPLLTFATTAQTISIVHSAFVFMGGLPSHVFV